MNTPAQRLMKFLEEGEENSKKGVDIEIEIGLGRDNIRNIILEENLPIGSTAKGYFLIANEEEFKKVMFGFNKRINGLEKRKKALEKGWGKKKMDNPSEI